MGGHLSGDQGESETYAMKQSFFWDTLKDSEASDKRHLTDNGWDAERESKTNPPFENGTVITRPIPL